MEDGQPLGDAPIERRCGACRTVTAVMVTQTVVEERIAWSVSFPCRHCGDTEEQCGWDEIPGRWRNVLVAQDGLVRVHADRQSSPSLKVRLLSVFRRQGATIAEAMAAFKSLVDGGIVGTPAEMRLLARHLTDAGAVVSLAPETSARPDRVRP